MTRGSRTSERKACYHAFYVSFAMGAYGIYTGADLTALAVLIGAVAAPLMFYAGARSAVKRAQGESDA